MDRMTKTWVGDGTKTVGAEERRGEVGKRNRKEKRNSKETET